MSKAKIKVLRVAVRVMAILGFITLLLAVGGKTYRHFSQPESYHISLGLVMLLPLVFELILCTRDIRKYLDSNPKNFDDEDDLLKYLDLKRRRNLFDLYVLNKTTRALLINRDSILRATNWYIFTLNKDNTLYLDNGIQFYVDKTQHLKTVDKRNQIIEIPKENFDKCGIPSYVDRAVIIDQFNVTAQ